MNAEEFKRQLGEFFEAVNAARQKAMDSGVLFYRDLEGNEEVLVPTTPNYHINFYGIVKKDNEYHAYLFLKNGEELERVEGEITLEHDSAQHMSIVLKNYQEMVQHTSVNGASQALSLGAALRSRTSASSSLGRATLTDYHQGDSRRNSDDEDEVLQPVSRSTARTSPSAAAPFSSPLPSQVSGQQPVAPEAEKARLYTTTTTTTTTSSSPSRAQQGPQPAPSASQPLPPPLPQGPQSLSGQAASDTRRVTFSESPPKEAYMSLESGKGPNSHLKGVSAVLEDKLRARVQSELFGQPERSAIRREPGSGVSPGRFSGAPAHASPDFTYTVSEEPAGRISSLSDRAGTPLGHHEREESQPASGVSSQAEHLASVSRGGLPLDRSTFTPPPFPSSYQDPARSESFIFPGAAQRGHSSYYDESDSDSDASDASEDGGRRSPPLPPAERPTALWRTQQGAIQHFAQKYPSVTGQTPVQAARGAAALTIQKEFRGFLEKSRALKASEGGHPQNRTRVRSATQTDRYTLIEPPVSEQIRGVNHVWFGIDRQNNYNVLTKAYGNARIHNYDVELQKRILGENAEKMMVNILKIVADELDLQDNQIIPIILQAKNQGGISNKYVGPQGGSTSEYKEIKAQNPLHAHFSGRFQQLCGECGIKSARNSNSPLRLTFLPERVIKGLEEKLSRVDLDQAGHDYRVKKGLVSGLDSSRTGG